MHSTLVKMQRCTRWIPVTLSRRLSSVTHSSSLTEIIKTYSTKEINMIELMVGRHNANNPALYYIDEDSFTTSTYSYADMERYSTHMASLLSDLPGLERGDRVAVMLPKSPQLVIAALGIWRLGYVLVPLFTAFQKDAIRIRLEDSNAKVVITDTANRQKFEFLSHSNDIGFVTTIIDPKRDNLIDQKSLIYASDRVFSIRNFQHDSVKSVTPVSISPQDTICLLYTSGTTGSPKGVAIPAFSLAAFHTYMVRGLGLQSGAVSTDNSSKSGQLLPQRYMSIADPGWAYGLYYNLIGPLIIGIAPTFLAGSFDPQKLLRTLAQCRVTHFAAAPSAYRALCAYEKATNVKDDFFPQLQESLQCASSAGEPLNPEIIDWWRSKMKGRTIADHYGQSEAGMMVNWHWEEGLQTPVKPDGSVSEWTSKGSMGRSMAGFRMVCLAHTEGVVDREVMNEPGELAVDMDASPLMWFQGYLNNPKRTEEALTVCRRYYLTGDTVTHKADGENCVFWFSTRKDDVIKSSGYRIGPFDVENALIADSRVAEVAVVGIPDPEKLRGEIVVAFIVLRTDCKAVEEKQLEDLRKELQHLVRENLSKHCFPRIIHFVSALPKTPSGKIQRFMLKQMLICH